MRYRPELPSPTSPGGLIGRAVAAVGAAIVLVAAFFLGFVVLAVVIGVAAIAGLALWLRLWWFSRQLRRRFDASGAAPRDPGTRREGQIIEGEFIEIREQRRESDL